MSLQKIRDWIIHGKIYLGRAVAYINFLNFGMLMYLSLSDLKKYGVYISLERYMIPLLALLYVVLILVGYIDDKLGIFREESRFVSEKNPQTTLILEEIKQIKCDIAKMRKVKCG